VRAPPPIENRSRHPQHRENNIKKFHIPWQSWNNFFSFIFAWIQFPHSVTNNSHHGIHTRLAGENVSSFISKSWGFSLSLSTFLLFLSASLYVRIRAGKTVPVRNGSAWEARPASSGRNPPWIFIWCATWNLDIFIVTPLPASRAFLSRLSCD